MAAPVGTNSFTSTESKKSEQTLREVISEVIEVPEFENFSLARSYSVNEIYNSTIATTKTGRDTTSEPDTGLLYYRGKVVGLGDNKWQKSNNNACQRIFQFLADSITLKLDSKRVFVVLDGPGFESINESGHVPGQSGGTLVRCQHHFTTLVCPKKSEITKEFKKYLRRIMIEEEQ